MNKPTVPKKTVIDAMTQTYGDLALTMLRDTPLSPAWRINFLANFFTGPIYRDIAEKNALSRPDFVILFCLLQCPGLVAQDICRVTGLPKNSISRAVTELLNRGFIQRGTDTLDKRAKPLALTLAGQAALNEVLPLFQARQEQMLKVLTSAEAAEFDRLMEKIIFAMPDWAAGD